MRPLKIAIIAGEVSGDLLGANLVAALRAKLDRPLELVGVGGPALGAEGLASLFDFGELSIMGVVAVLKRLPRLIALIGKTADAVIAARPDILIIIDSPDFTHRVARRVRKARPDLPVVNYVCPSVWAWKEYRAREMLAYVDHVLAVLPFEPDVMRQLGGPECTYVGHRLQSLPALREARARTTARPVAADPPHRTILLLPGSRGHEIKRLLPIFRETVDFLLARGAYRLLLPTVPQQLTTVRRQIEDWPVKPEVIVGEDGKWQAFAGADAALAASGTVILELALAGIPTVSCYRTDFFIRLALSRIKVWSAALPNLIADRPIVPEYFDEFLRPAMLGRWLECLSRETPQRQAMLAGFQMVFERMETEMEPGEKAAETVLQVLDDKTPAWR